jgi:HSP20 family molecular chaperone IbpA
MNQNTENQLAQRPQPALVPAVDVIEDAGGITLYADLPGVPRDKLDIRVEGEQLTIEGELQLPIAEGLEGTHAEVTLPLYRRVFNLSRELDCDKVAAELRDGVLTLRIPKAEHAQPRRIDVRAA